MPQLINYEKLKWQKIQIFILHIIPNAYRIYKKSVFERVLKTEHSYQYSEYSRKPTEVQQSDNMKPVRYLRNVHKSGLGFL